MTTAISEWTTVDKSTWGPGPWQDEPDKVHWIDQKTDLDCLMVRSQHGGNWCGYVAVTEGHPLFGVGYSETYKLVPFDEDGGNPLGVHGGLTYADFCMETDDESRFVCHVPQPGRPDRVWWFGFDCAHSHDRSPGYEARNPGFSSDYQRYRDRGYVEREVTRLARQLAELAR